MKRLITVMVLLVVLGVPAVFASGQAEGEEIVLVGAAMVPEDHVYTQALIKFKELVEEYYDGDVTIQVSHSGELGEERDFFEFMMDGTAVDFAIVSPGHIANWDDQFAFLDTPFLWEDVDHWNSGLESTAFDPLEENVRDLGVRILGYAGGGQRNLILDKEIETVSDLPSVKMRVQGSPIQARVFDAVGVQATPMDYLEVYNGIKSGVIDGLENEASSLITMKFYEVAPNIVLTSHTITIRPLCFSEERFAELPSDLQEAILRAGEEASRWAREAEVSAGPEILAELENDGKINTIMIDNAEIRRRAVPVVEAYAEELGLAEVYAAIRGM